MLEKSQNVFRGRTVDKEMCVPCCYPLYSIIQISTSISIILQAPPAFTNTVYRLIDN